MGAIMLVARAEEALAEIAAGASVDLVITDVHPREISRERNGLAGCLV